MDLCQTESRSERVCNRLKSKRFVEGAAGKTEEKPNSGHFVINIFVPLTQVVTESGAPGSAGSNGVETYSLQPRL